LGARAECGHLGLSPGNTDVPTRTFFKNKEVKK
jgi:hypothetical protein